MDADAHDATLSRGNKGRRKLATTFFVCCLTNGHGGFAEVGAAQTPMKVIALGTSLTHSGGWLKPLEQQLTECLDQSVNVLDFGRDGATSEWGVAILPDVVQAEPDVVLIEFSVNDAALFKGISLRKSQENVRKIVLAVRKARPLSRIFLMTMNPAFGPRAWIRPRMNAYYDAYRVLADELGIGYIDNLRDWNNLPEAELRAHIPDGLHPEPKWAHRILVPGIVSAIGGTAGCETGTSLSPRIR